jgi:hypothetical protein
MQPFPFPIAGLDGPTGGGYDEQAVALIRAIERQLARLRLGHRLGAFAAILSALEYQVEEGEGHPSVVRHLGDALLALAAIHTLPVAAVKDITQTLGRLHGHVSARASLGAR